MQAQRRPQGSHGEPPGALEHDALNLIASLELFCELLAEPGVLSAGKEFMATDLRMVASAGSRLIKRLAGDVVAENQGIHDLAAAVHKFYGPLKAIAGKTIDLEMECLPCPGEVGISEEALARVLINLVRNAAEVMPQGGRIRVSLQQGEGGSFLADYKDRPRTALLCVQDSGPGISTAWIEHVFEEGFSTKECSNKRKRGQGLSITRRLVEDAGGSIRAVSVPGCGARFEVELPLIPVARENETFSAEFPEKAVLQC